MTVLERVAALIEDLPGERVLVAFDGPDAAGKTTLARAVADRLSRPSLCASVDGWHHPRDVRLRRGPESPAGYYADSFDLEALVRDLLEPFREGATRVRTEATAQQYQDLSRRCVLLLDGVFLLRPELRSHWDLSVYLHVPEEVTLARALVRDLDQYEDSAALRRRYQRRYLPGQTLYRDSASPLQAADVVIDNSDWDDPLVLRWPSA